MRLSARVSFLLLLLPLPASAQDVLCNTTVSPPFVVTSGAPFTIAWLMPSTATENGQTVPNRYDGFYLQIDAGPKVDIGKATPGTPCPPGNSNANNVPHTYRTTSGVSKGSHNAKLSSWNFVLDGNGNPTTNRAESAVVTVPFSGGDPVLTGPPNIPFNVWIGTGQPTQLNQPVKEKK